tara:strand:- start:2240 stop:2917 length:678 start_codon:yes stop_codon:yes gene_type:complete
MINNNFRNDVRVLKENKHYRFSDLFFKKGIRWENDRNTILNDIKFKDSILRQYLEQKTKEQDYETLKEIIKDYISKNNLKCPSESELVIHLRCGDIFEKIDKADARRVKKQYILIDNLFKKQKKIFTNKINKVSVVTAMHFGANELNQKYFYSKEVYNENIKFLEFFEGVINNIGYELNIISNNDFDQDLCYMTGSNFFLKGISNVTDIVERCLVKNAKVYSFND